MTTIAPRFERGTHEARDVVRAVRGVDERLRAGVHVLPVEHCGAQLLAELGAARLARQHDLAPRELAEPLPEQARLRRLADAVAALEGDEVPGCAHGDHPSRDVGHGPVSRGAGRAG